MAVQLTVALCTYNPCPDLIARAAGAVVSQLRELGESAEFVIIDNNSDPPLEGADYLSGLPVEIVREPVQGLTAARETAIRRARGTVVLFVDDDNILAPGYLAGALAAFADPTLGIVGGAVVPEYGAKPPAWLAEFEPYLAVRRYAADFVNETVGLPYNDYFPIGAGLAVLRSLAVDYVDDARATGRIEGRRGLALSSGEDLDLDLFALSRGFKLRVTGALSLTHAIPARRLTEEYISELLVSTQRSSLELDRKWQARFGQPIFSHFHDGGAKAWLRSVVFRAASPWSARYRVKQRLWSEIHRLRRASSSS